MILFAGTTLIAGAETADVAVSVISTDVAVVEMATEPEYDLSTVEIRAATVVKVRSYSARG